jgi:uncharacterized membrane protein
MFLNVWLIIWPKQKVIVASALSVINGGQANPEAAKLGPQALLASRTNVMFSMPMLFFMGGASHIPLNLSPEKSLVPYWATFAFVIGLIELNAIKGKMGPLQKLVAAIHLGLALTLALYLAMEFLAG